MLAVPIVFGIVFLFQSETPVYMIRKGKVDKIPKAYKKFRGKDYDPSEEIKTIQEQMASEAESAGFWETLKTKAAIKATLICFMLMFYQQLSGINAVIFYAKEIFTSAGSSLEAHWCVIIIGIVQVIATVFSSWSIELLGRKILLMASCALMALSTALLGLFFSLKNYEALDKYGIQDIGFLPILSLIIFIIAFSIGLGPIPWLASSEIFPPEIKAKCGSAAAVFNWFLAFIVTKFYLNVASAIGNDITFYFFAIVMVTGIFFVLFIIPETKNKTFAEIQSELSGK
ncbi:facilitated trehalose transporter Tret1-like [Anoplophora glabripennis]|nr:facilitated trehalose transporter Tret1-like [Anoplophora glabripennis]